MTALEGLAKDFKPVHFLWKADGKVATLTLNRPEKKNPLTFESYAELVDTFKKLPNTSWIKSVIITGAGGNFCSGGDVHEIIGELVKMTPDELLEFTSMSCELILAIRECPQMVVSAIDGICAGAGAAIAMASDLRIGSDASKVAFLFAKVGLAGCDMGACAMLPRIVGQGRAAELLLTGRSMDSREAFATGFYNKVCSAAELPAQAQEMALALAEGPTMAHAVTKKMLNFEWNMGIKDALQAEAQAQALCMESGDFKRAYEAFAVKQKPHFQGN